MPQPQTAPHLDEIVRALGDKVGREVNVRELEEELGRYLEYGVPPEQARSIILRKHGVVPPKGAPGGSRKTLEELHGAESFVNLLVRVVHVGTKEITVRGEKKTIQTGILGDETRTRPFTAWKTLEIEKGDVIKVVGAYTKEYQGEAQINFGDRVQIEKVDKTLLPPPPGPGYIMERPDGPLRVSDLRPGDAGIEVAARILNVSAKPVTVQGQTKTVYSGTLGDGTGKVAFNAWHDFGLKEGEVVRVKGAYVKAFRGTAQLTFDERSAVERLAQDAMPSLHEIDHQGPVPLSVLYQGAGQADVTVEATLLEVRPGSGLVKRCTDCKRVLRNGVCGVHGKVEGKLDLRVKAILDDGTAAVNAIFGRELTEQMLGKTMAEWEALAKENMSTDVVEAEAKARLTARVYRVRGAVLVDEYGPMFLAKEAVLVQRDLSAAAEALLAELEGVA
ncbi:MAG TPA: hypothetical protein VI818_02625 [Candidatus Thermoplasmatota archaeon]|nr:hypothetical protein [Candidatus Thermoplasmatota archaeon]